MYDEEKVEQADAPERASSRLPLSHQEKALVELHDTIAQLASRLKPVLTPVTTEGGEPSTDKAAPVQSPLAEQLEANNGGIRKASNKLRALMERLEC